MSKQNKCLFIHKSLNMFKKGKSGILQNRIFQKMDFKKWKQLRSELRI